MSQFILWLTLAGLPLSAVAQGQLVLSDARVAPDAQKFAVSASSSLEFSVFEQPLAPGSQAARISPPAPEFHCFAPAYSPDGRFLLYLKEPTGNSRKLSYADVILYDRTTQTSRMLTAGQQLITQALFSPDGQRIVYCAAGFWGSYSPVGPKAAHELDVFSMALDGSDVVQHSQLKAYALGNMRLFKAPATYLLNVTDPRQQLSGTYVFSLNDPTQLRAVKDSVAQARGFRYLPEFTVSRNQRLVFSIDNEMFAKNMKTGSVVSVYLGPASAKTSAMAFLGDRNFLLFSETVQTSPPIRHGAFSIRLLNLDDLTVAPVTLNLKE